jgi:3',5'-cyclic AMP phosphodiesterase CpdA
MAPFRLAWATDIHLEFCETPVIDAFLASVAAATPDAVVITGDIGTARNIVDVLARIDRALSCPVYFVLGNHDLYHGSIEGVREAVERQAHEATRLSWLTKTGVRQLTTTTALIGVDGWSDGRFGDYARSNVMLSDYLVIQDLSYLEPDERLRSLQRLADAEAALLAGYLRDAVAGHTRIVVATHVPPFADAAWHEGQRSDDNWLPHFSSKATGDVLLAAAERHPDREFLVLCGHTHGGGTIDVLPNLRVITGPAVYGAPSLQHVFEL